MSIDVTKEKNALKEYLQMCVARYESEDPVGFIQLGYQTIQAGLFSVYFDSKEEAGPDGSWTLHLEENSLARDHWAELVEADEENVVELAQIIAAAFVEARDQGFLDSLPMTKDCDFGIEEFDGIFGWPEFEERKKVNLVRDVKF